jgi:low temperature requirement protein LtrA
MIVAGTAVAGEARTADLVAVVAASIVVACLLWWTYFGWLKDALEHRFAAVEQERLGPLARDAFSLAHFPLIGGIVGFAVAVEETVAHPADPMPTRVLAALGLGVALFVASSAASLWRLGGPVLVPRLGVLALVSAALAVTAGTAPHPVVPMLVVAAGLLALVIIEAVVPPERHTGAAGRGRVKEMA